MFIIVHLKTSFLFFCNKILLPCDCSFNFKLDFLLILPPVMFVLPSLHSFVKAHHLFALNTSILLPFCKFYWLYCNIFIVQVGFCYRSVIKLFRISFMSAILCKCSIIIFLFKAGRLSSLFYNSATFLIHGMNCFITLMGVPSAAQKVRSITCS